jgi:hypothetical protein
MGKKESALSSSEKENFFHYLYRLISCEGWFVAIAALAAFAIRFYIAYTGSYWVDEIVMINVGRGSTQALINFLVTDTAQGPFSWLLIHGLVRISQAEWFLRLFQVLAGSLAVYYAYFFMRDTMGRRAGLIAAVLMAMSLNGINYSTDCRYYSYLVLFSLAMAHHYQAALATGLKRHYFMFGIATLLNIYNGHFAFFLGLIIVIHLVGRFIIGIIRKQSRLPVNRLIFIALAGIIALLLYLPWLGVMLSFFAGPWGITGGNFSGEATGGTTLSRMLIMIGGRFGIGSFARPEADWHSFIFPLLFILMWVQGRKGMSNRIFLLLWLVLPLYIMLSVQARHYFTIRYFMIIFPPLLLSAAGGIDRIWTVIKALAGKLRPSLFTPGRIPLLKFAPLATAAAILLLSYPNIADLVNYPKQDWKRSVAYIKQNAKPGDVLFLNYGDKIGTFYYFRPSDYGLLVENRDDALPWVCDGSRDVWLVSHYFENNSVLFQNWVRSNMELVRIMPGTMIPIYIFRFHRPENVVRDSHIVWYSILSPHADGEKMNTDLGTRMTLPEFQMQAGKGESLGWIRKLAGDFITRVHCSSPADQNTCKLAAYDDSGAFLSHQQQLWQDELTPTLLWRKRKPTAAVLEIENGNQSFSIQSTEVTTAQRFGPAEGINIALDQDYVQRFFVTTAGVWQILLSGGNELDTDLTVSIDGNPVPLKSLGGDIWQVEVGLLWGTHCLKIRPRIDMHLNWINISHELFPPKDLPVPGRTLIKRIDNLDAGDYLLTIKADAHKGNRINPLGWLEVFDPERRLTLYRMLLNSNPTDISNQYFFKPEFYSGFPDTSTANLSQKTNDWNDLYMAFRALDGPLEVYYTELSPGGVDWYDMEMVPFTNNAQTRELLDESTVEYFCDAANFHHNVGTLDSSGGNPEICADGEGKPDYLAWGFTCDVPEGAYILEANITEHCSNFTLDDLNDIGGIMEKSAGRKRLFSVVHGMLTLEGRVFWTGKGTLRLESMRLENLAGPLDVGILFKRVEQYYKKKNRRFDISDIKELQFDKMIKVFP